MMDARSARHPDPTLVPLRKPDSSSLTLGNAARRAASGVIVAATGLVLASCGTLSLEADSPVTIDELGQGVQDEAIEVKIDGPASVTYRKITIEPGGGTGEHCHYGQLIAVVTEGTFTHYAPIYPEGMHTYDAGESIIEGSSYVHEGRNEGTEDVVLWVTYVTPEGKPLAEATLANCDH